MRKQQVDTLATLVWILLRDHFQRTEQQRFIQPQFPFAADLLHVAGNDRHANVTAGIHSLKRLREKQQAVEAAATRVFPRLFARDRADVPRVYDRLREAFARAQVLQQRVVIFAASRIQDVATFGQLREVVAEA